MGMWACVGPFVLGNMYFASSADVRSMSSSLFRKFKLPSIRIRRSRSSTNGETEIQGKLAAMIQTLNFAEKVAEASSVPFLKGAIGLVIVVAECARVCDLNKSSNSYRCLKADRGSNRTTPP